VAAVTAVQGAYFVGTGVWPLVHLPSFERVTGPKTERWLVRTVGALTAVVGATLLVASGRRREDLATQVLAIGSAAALGLIDAQFVARGRIAPIYLLDAFAEALLIAGRAMETVRGGI
jgi:hypothetical protein